MENNNPNVLQNYQDELKLLEVSKLDTSSNYKNASEFASKIFNDENLIKDDKVNLLSMITVHFSLDKEQSTKLAETCINIYANSKQGKEEYLSNLIAETSTDELSTFEIIPYMEYTQEHGLSYMAIMKTKENKKLKCFVSSKKEVCKYDDCPNKGIYLKHTKNNSKFNIQSFFKFMKNEDNVVAGEIFSKLKNVLIKHIIFPAECLYDIVSLWIMHTYIYCIFRYVPYIWLNAEAGSGKSTVLDVVKEYAFNGETNLGATSAIIFRTIDNNGSTLFLDEFENMTGDDKSLILTILKGGFKQGATVKRCSTNNNEPETFNAFSPKMFAGISEIDNVLLSRCIKINMKMTKDLSKITEFNITPEVKKEISQTVNDLHIFGLKYVDEIYKLYTDKNLLVFPANYTPREKDLWKPLYAIAKIVDRENNTNTVDSVLKYAEILRQELNKAMYTGLTPRLLKYLNILVEEQSEFKENQDWYGLDYIYNFLKGTGEFEEIKSYESLGKFLSKFELKKARKVEGPARRKYTAYHITKDILTDLKNKYNLDIV